MRWSTMVWPGAVVRGGQVRFGDRQADAVGEALAERAGGQLDAGRQAVLGVAGRLAAPLAEALQVVERQVVAGQVQQAVQQHAAVAGGEREPVAVGPLRVARVVAQEARPQHVGHRRRAERQPGMAAVGLLHGVDRQRADRVDRELIQGRGHGQGLRRNCRPATPCSKHIRPASRWARSNRSFSEASPLPPPEGEGVTLENPLTPALSQRGEGSLTDIPRVRGPASPAERAKRSGRLYNNVPGWLYALLVFGLLAVAGQILDAPPVLVFAAACLGLVPLAGLIGHATGQVALHLGAQYGGLLNATFGNAT